MARTKKPGEYPEWLFETARLFPLADTAMCQWLCSGCGAPHYFPQTGKRHGGPTRRAVDPRYSTTLIGPCWRSKDYGVKCVTPKGTRVLFHEGAPNPEQPEQLNAVWTTDNTDQKEGQYDW